MLTENFYDILDGEIDAIISRYKTHPNFARHKDPNQKKAYGFLVWFLEFYGQLPQFKNYITNGNDDASCDIIFDKSDTRGVTVFYVVQAKWSTRKNALGQIKSKDVKYSLNDFETIIRGDKQKTRNEKFNKSYESLLEHLKKNGKVKFIFLALSRESTEYVDNVASFNKNNAPNIFLEIIDIERIKRDYIDMVYKGIKKTAPLEMQLDPEYSKITLQIERFTGVPGKGDIITKTGTYRSYIVMIKPRVIHELFKTFGFSLFYRNVRNPLHESNYNDRIARTLRERPALFWYFNNGITAISKIIPEIGNEALEIEVTGLQVINGAQTVYSVYSAYEKASAVEREIMDKDALIMLRLVDSSDEHFNLEITRYTNSQNPMFTRDFHANDDVQVRLQQASFDFTYWYEKRRGEFRQVPKEIKVVENQVFAVVYLAFFMEDVKRAVFKNHLIFTSKDLHPEGLYETIFTPAVKFEHMLASYRVVEKILAYIHSSIPIPGQGKPISWDFNDERFLLALVIAFLFKLVLKHYLNLKFNPGKTGEQTDITPYILENRIEKKTFDSLLRFGIDFVVYSFNLFNGKGRINIKALKGKEIIEDMIDSMQPVFRQKAYEIKQLENPESVFGKYSSSLKDFANIWMNSGDRDKAAGLFEKALDIDPKNIRVLNSYANACVKWGDKTKALELLEKSTAINERHLPSIISYANAYMNWGDRDKAQELFERALAIDAGNVQVLNSFANACTAWGDRDKAQELFERALKVDDKHVPTLNSYANASAAWGDRYKAIELFERALELDPKNNQVLNSYANVSVDWGDRDKAIDLFEKSLSIEPEHVLTLISYSNACAAWGNKEKSRFLLEKAEKSSIY
jgi:tetratricopeptide (TPR) repeat protein